MEAPLRDFPQVVGGPSPLVRRNRNAERRQHRRERRLQLEAAAMPSSPLDLSRVSIAKCVGSVQEEMAAAATPPSLLDLSRVSIAKCVGSIQTQPGCSGAKSTYVSDSETKSDRARISTSANTDKVDQVPIIGHARTIIVSCRFPETKALCSDCSTG